MDINGIPRDLRNLRSAVLTNDGVEKVTNGTFTGNATGWTLASGWAYSANTVIKNGAGSGALEQAVGAQDDEIYLVTASITNWTAGTTLTPSIGGTDGTAITGDASYSEYIITSNVGNLKFTPTTDVRCTIDGVSAKKVDAIIIKDSTGAITGWIRGDGVVSIAGQTISGYTGTGNIVRATSPTLVTPALGTPSSGDLQNCTLATPSTKGVVYLEVKANLLPNTERKANSGCTLENVGSNLVTGWTNSVSDPYETFTSAGADITSAINSSAFGHCNGNVMAIANGKLYKVDVTLTLNSGAAPELWVSPTQGTNANAILTNATLSAGANTFVFEGGSTVNQYLQIETGNGVATDFSLTITFYEQVRSYIAADTVGPDGCTKTSTLKWRVVEQDSTHGCQYYTDQWEKGADTAEYANLMSITNRADLDKYKGFPVTFAFVGYSVTATDNVKLQIYDGVGTTESAFLTADAKVPKEITRTIDASATELTFRVLLDGDTGDVAYGSFEMAVNGSSIGAYNYAPKVGEVVDFVSSKTLASYNNVTISANATLNLEVESAGVVGKGVKAVYGRLIGSCTAAGDQIYLNKSSASQVFGIDIEGQVNGVSNRAVGRIPCDANGDIYLYRSANFTSAYIMITGIKP